MSVIHGNNRVTLTALFPTNNMVWRNLSLLLEDKKSYREFQIPSPILTSSNEIQREFIRGIVDGSGWVEPGTYYRVKDKGKRRVFLAVDNNNWILPVQLCGLLQQKLKIPVGEILWGNPNLRDPRCKYPQIGGLREHQIRIFCESFENIGFYLDYKDTILKEFALEDKMRTIPADISYHYLGKKYRKARKANHPQENSNKLPSKIRGKHFDYFWQICKKMGCKQHSPPSQKV